VVKLLLGVSGVDVNASDRDGDTSLLTATRKGHEAVVRVLLCVPEININFANDRGKTPLSIAAAKGHNTIVQLLLATPGIDNSLVDVDVFENPPMLLLEQAQLGSQ
jgi:ankyrin repeat protein